MKQKVLLFVLWLALATGLQAQSISEHYFDVNAGLPTQFDTPGSIVYPTGYTAYNTYTPVVFVHGITGKLSGAFEANIESVKRHHLQAAFVQLHPTGTPEENGKLLKRMIDRIASHFHCATVSIAAHSKGGLDTERALYGENPYQSGIPSFGYEKVDAVYTFGSPLKGSRVADVGASLSWLGIPWIAMWYLNGFSLTSASVQEFHNWAQSWNIISNGTFRNYYNPNGASYTRRNMIEDNTTRWWAHQSDDPCYENKWYFCYVGNGFHHTAGAYYDAYWEWDWFNSGWRNWHTDNDGFIAVYRARREVIQNASPALTPGAGDSNYITMHDANHTSLWDPGEGHFDREAAPYLHYGLYGYYRPASQPQQDKASAVTTTGVTAHPVYMSNGYIGAARSGKHRFVVENDGDDYQLVIWSEQPVQNISLVQNNQKRSFRAVHSAFNQRMNSYENVFELSGMPRGRWETATGFGPVVMMARNLTPQAAFGVKWNWDEAKGFEGKPVEVKVSGEELDYSHVEILVLITELAGNEAKFHRIIAAKIDEKGHASIDLAPYLQAGHKYAIEVIAQTGDKDTHGLSRTAFTTVYVPENLPVRDVEVSAKGAEKSELGFMPSVFPNPATDLVNITSDKTDFTARLYNAAGMEVRQWTAEGFQLQAGIKGLPAGVYLLKIETTGGVHTRKLVIR